MPFISLYYLTTQLFVVLLVSLPQKADEPNMKMHIEFSVPDEIGAELIPTLIETIQAAQPEAWQLNVAATRPDPSLQPPIAHSEPVTDAE